MSDGSQNRQPPPNPCRVVEGLGVRSPGQAVVGHHGLWRRNGGHDLDAAVFALRPVVAAILKTRPWPGRLGHLPRDRLQVRSRLAARRRPAGGSGSSRAPRPSEAPSRVPATSVEQVGPATAGSRIPDSASMACSRVQTVAARPGSGWVGSWPVVVSGPWCSRIEAKPLPEGLWLSLPACTLAAWPGPVRRQRCLTGKNRRSADGSGSAVLAAHWAGRHATTETRHERMVRKQAFRCIPSSAWRSLPGSSGSDGLPGEHSSLKERAGVKRGFGLQFRLRRRLCRA